MKENQGNRYKAVVSLFNSVDWNGRSVSRVVEEEYSHGRQEHREYFQTTIPNDFPEASHWNGLRSVGMTRRTHVDSKGEPKTETRFFISSERRNGKAFASYVRGHWGSENSSYSTGFSMPTTAVEEESCRETKNGRLEF